MNATKRWMGELSGYAQKSLNTAADAAVEAAPPNVTRLTLTVHGKGPSAQVSSMVTLESGIALPLTPPANPAEAVQHLATVKNAWKALSS